MYITLIDFSFRVVGIVTLMLILSWNLFLLALITGPLAFGTAKIYGDLIDVRYFEPSRLESPSLSSVSVETTEEDPRYSCRGQCTG